MLQTSFETQASLLLKKLDYSPKTQPQVRALMMSQFRQLTPAQKSEWLSIRIRRCYSLISSNNASQLKELIASVISVAEEEKYLPKPEVEHILQKAFIVNMEEETIRMFKDHSMWEDEVEMLQYKEQGSSFRKWLRELCG